MAIQENPLKLVPGPSSQELLDLESGPVPSVLRETLKEKRAGRYAGR